MLATAAEYVVSVTSGFGVTGGLSLVPSLAIISLAPTTLAYIDQDAVVTAVGNVLVQARDDTHTDILVGSLGLGFLASVGASLGSTFITKDTEAYVAAGATVNAQAAGGAGITVYSGDTSGTGFGTSTIDGLGVEAESSENLVTAAGSGGAGGLVSVVGAFSITIDESTTKAYIDNDARINQDTPNASAAQTVNVSAVNSVNTLGAPGNLSVGVGNLAGSVDLGIIRNNTLAYTGKGAAISAAGDIDVYALSAMLVQSAPGGAGAAVAGLDGSLSLYSVGAVLDPNSLNELGNLAVDADQAIQQLAYGASSAFASILDAYTGLPVPGVALVLSNSGFASILNANSSLFGQNINAAATSISGASPVDAVTANVDSTAATRGTAATIDGSDLHAGQNVNVQGTDDLQTIADTSFTFALGLSSLPFTLSADLALVNTDDGGQAYVIDGANISAAGDVNVLGEADNQNEVVAMLAENNLSNTAAAYVDGSTVMAGGAVTINATSAAKIEATPASYLPGFSGLAVRLAQNNVTDHVDAHVSDNSVVTAGGPFSVLASDNGSIEAVSIAVTISGDVGLGAAYSENHIASAVTAYIDGSRAMASSVNVAATFTPQITAITVGGAYGGFGGAGSTSQNQIAATIEAYVADSSVVNATSDLMVTATDGSGIFALAGSGAGGGGVALGLSYAANSINNTVSAQVENSTATATYVQIVATASPNVSAIAVGGAGALAWRRAARIRPTRSSRTSRRPSPAR